MKEKVLILLCVSSFCLIDKVPAKLHNKLDLKDVLSWSLLGPYINHGGSADSDRPKTPPIVRKSVKTDSKSNVQREDETFAYTSDFVNVDKSICCTSDQWESSAYLTSGDVYYDANTFFAYFNGTGKIAFDRKIKKSYVSFNITEFTPLMPGPGQHATLTTIKDFEKGVMYQIDGDGNCEKQNTSSEGISIMCIPERAKRVSNGTLGSGVNVATYEFPTYSGQVLNRVTVAQTLETCEPIVSTFAIIKSNPNTLYILDVMDVTPQISDPSVFTPPASCDG